MVAVPAMFGPVTIINLTVIIWIFSLFQEVFHEVNGIIEIKAIHVAAVNMNFSR